MRLLYNYYPLIALCWTKPTASFAWQSSSHTGGCIVVPALILKRWTKNTTVESVGKLRFVQRAVSWMLGLQGICDYLLHYLWWTWLTAGYDHCNPNINTLNHDFYHSPNFYSVTSKICAVSFSGTVQHNPTDGAQIWGEPQWRKKHLSPLWRVLMSYLQFTKKHNTTPVTMVALLNQLNITIIRAYYNK